MAVAAITGSAWAQDPNPALFSALREAQRQGALPRVPQTKPTEPKGFPGLPPKEGPLPLPQPPRNDDSVVKILDAGNIERSGNILNVTGGATVQYRGYDIIADEVTGDLNTEIFDAVGHVKVQGADAQVRGDKVRVSFKDRTYRAWTTESQLQPALLNGQFLDTVYVKSKESFGSQREIFSTDSDTTTCSYPRPHYYIDARKSTVRPGIRAIFHDMSLVVLGRTMLKLPFLSVPLNQPTYRYVPEVGKNEQDGYFIKTRYGIPLDNPKNNLDARADYFQKRGTALGGDYSYAGNALAGLLSIYGLAGLDQTLTITSQHQQKFHWGSLNLNTNYQKNNFQSSPGATLLNTRLQLLFPQGVSSSRLSLYQNDSKSASFTSTQQTVNLGDTRVFNKNLKTNLDLSMVGSHSGAIKQERVDVRFTGDDDLKKAVAHFEYIRSIPVGQVTNFFNSSDVTPSVALNTDSRRLLGPKALPNWPFTTGLAFGEYVNPSSRDHISRMNYNLNFQRTDNSEKRAKLNLDGRFQQGMYSDGTAQYILGLGTAFSYSLGKDTALNLRYNYLRPYGYSPLVIDQTGKTNLLSGDLAYRPWRPFLVGIQSAYDLESVRLGNKTGYQFVGVRTEYAISNWFTFRTLSNYDPFQQAWNSVRLDIAYRPGATFVSLGSQYDGIRHVWGSANLFVDGFKWGRFRASTLLQYNGYLKKFQTQHYSFIYDLHCAEAVLEVLDNQTGFRPGRQVIFFLRIKAFPFDSPFGTGSFGQALGTGGGVRF